MKKLVGLVVILGVLILGGYYAMGFVAERAVKRNLALVNQTSNGISAQISQYSRGFFRSFAQLNWDIHIPEHLSTSGSGTPELVKEQDFNLETPLTIYHGPIIFSEGGPKFGLGFAKTEIDMPTKYSSQFAEFFDSSSIKPRLVFSLFINYFSQSQIEIGVPAFQLKAKEGGTFDWKGLTSAMNIDRDFSVFKGDFLLEGFELQKDETKVKVGEVSTEYNLHKTTSGLFLGDASLSLPSLEVDTNNTKYFELLNFDSNSNCDIENGLFSSHFKTGLEKVTVNGVSYGPGNLELSIRNLDADALAHIHQQLRVMQTKPEGERKSLVLNMLSDIPKLLSRGPEVEISDLSLGLPKGSIEGNLLLSVPAGDSSNPFDLLQKLEGKGRLKVPTMMVEQLLGDANRVKMAASPSVAPVTPVTPEANAPSTALPPTEGTSVVAKPAEESKNVIEEQVSIMTQNQLTTMQNSGLIVKDGDYYVINIELDKGHLKVNGKPFDASMLQIS